MDTLIMTRTVCCESYKTFGKRCSVCPNRPENRQAIEEYMVAIRGFVSQKAPETTNLTCAAVAEAAVNN